MGVAEAVSVQRTVYELVTVLQGTAPGTLLFIGEEVLTGQLVSALGTIRRCSDRAKLN